MNQTSIQLPGFRMATIGAVGVITILGLVRIAWCGEKLGVRLA